MSKSISPEEYTKTGKWIGETEQNVPKDDFISRKRLYKILEGEEVYHRNSGLTQRADGVLDAMMDVIEAPSADAVEVRHGRWEIYIISMLDGEGCKCSECGFEGVPYWDYCPNCGARMDGE